MAAAEQIASLQQQLAQAQQQQPPAVAVAAAAAAHHAALPQLPRMAPMSKFKGQMGSALDNWERELRQHFDYYSHLLNTDASKVKYASANLQEGALLHYQAGLAQNVFGVSSTFDDFMKHMRKRYRPVDASRQARARLTTLQQQNSVNSYTEAFQATLAHISDMGASDQVFNYVKGLRRDIAVELQKKWPSTLDEAISMAISLDYAGNSTGSSRRGFHSSSGSSAMDLSQSTVDEEEPIEETAAAASDPTAMLLAKLTAMEQKLNAMQSSSRGGASSSSYHPPRRSRMHVSGVTPEIATERIARGQCIACGEKGHWKNECPTAKKQTNGRSVASAATQQPGKQ
jgi:hypothetical protein